MVWIKSCECIGCLYIVGVKVYRKELLFCGLCGDGGGGVVETDCTVNQARS